MGNKYQQAYHIEKENQQTYTYSDKGVVIEFWVFGQFLCVALLAMFSLRTGLACIRGSIADRTSTKCWSPWCLAGTVRVRRSKPGIRVVASLRIIGFKDQTRAEAQLNLHRSIWRWHVIRCHTLRSRNYQLRIGSEPYKLKTTDIVIEVRVFFDDGRYGRR